MPQVTPQVGPARQLALLAGGQARKARRILPPQARLAAHLPVARVLVDVPLPHLDRPFDYAVPQMLDDLVRPGVRVKVRFAGQDVDGFVVERAADTDHSGPLTPLRRVVSDEPVLTPHLLALCRAVAAEHAGPINDVLRLAIPPRHATAEKALARQAPAHEPVPMPEPGPWAQYPAGPSFVRRVGAGGGPAAAWTALPQSGGDWAQALAVAAAAALSAGRGAVLVVPDHRDVERVDAALREQLGPGRHVRLTADQGPQARYTAWLKLLRGHVRCVVGARAAAFAPVADPGLLAWWDDGDDLHAEPRTPYPHVRAVLLRRAQLQADQAARITSGAARPVGERGDSGAPAGHESVDPPACGEPVDRGGRVPGDADAAAARPTVAAAAGASGPQATTSPGALAGGTGHAQAVAGSPDAAGEDLGGGAEAGGGGAGVSAAPAVLVGGVSRSVAVQQLVEDGVLREIVPEPATRRGAVPRVRLAVEGPDAERDGVAARAHLPSMAWRAAREALTRGPVLVQVPRRGYVPSLSCATCRAPARCPRCHGPLALPGPSASPTCRWCASVAAHYVCPECHGVRLRASAVGARRTAEELGRAFPGALVRTSGGHEVIDRVPELPALVIATPGAEPVADGGYAATLLLDAWALLDRPRLDAGEEALRRWLGAAALTRSHRDGGIVVLAGTPEHETLAPVEALVRWAPEWFAARELAERRELGLPPAVWTARITGPYGALDEVLREVTWPPEVARIGPTAVDTPPGAATAPVAAPTSTPTSTPAPPRAARGAGARMLPGSAALSEVAMLPGAASSSGAQPSVGTGTGGVGAPSRPGSTTPASPTAQRPAQLLLMGPPHIGPAMSRLLTDVRRSRSARRDTAQISVRIGEVDLL